MAKDYKENDSHSNEDNRERIVKGNPPNLQQKQPKQTTAPQIKQQGSQQTKPQNVPEKHLTPQQKPPLRQDSRYIPQNRQNQTNQQRTQFQNNPKRQGQYFEERRNGPFLSVVIPVYNEEDSLPELSLQIEDELSKVANGNYEIIFVDDGSTDNSFTVIKQIKERNNRFKAIRFNHNYGKSAALAVGFAEAKGFIIATMDADLQDDPSEIHNLLSKLKEGYDLVSGWKKRRNDPITKTIPSKLFNLVTSAVSGIRLHDFNCGLKVYRKEVAKSLQVYGELHRYLPVLAYWDGFRVTEIPVKHHSRRYGKTKYGFARFFNGFFDLITILFTTKYFKRPLHFFGTFGVLFATAGFGVDLYLLIQWLLGNTYLSNRPLALFGIALIIVGVQLFSFGLIGEMIVKNSVDKLKYTIKERLF